MCWRLDNRVKDTEILNLGILCPLSFEHLGEVIVEALHLQTLGLVGEGRLNIRGQCFSRKGLHDRVNDLDRSAPSGWLRNESC